MKRFLQVALLVVSSACVPLPHFETRMPHVSGVVTLNGAPLSGATVRISDSPAGDWSCSKGAVATSATDSSGHFDLKASKKFRLVRPLIGDPIYTNQLCIINGEKVYLGYTEGGVGYPPDSLSLSCRIDSGSRPVDDKTPGAARRAVCTLLRRER